MLIRSVSGLGERLQVARKLLNGQRWSPSAIAVVAVQRFHGYANEPTHPIPGRKPKTVSAADAVSVVKSGDTVFIHGAAATPRVLVPALTDHGRSAGLKNVTVQHIHTEGAAEYNDPSLEGVFRSNSLFTGANCRKAINEGRADFTPIFLGEIPLLFYRGIIKPDVAMVQVTPADKHGYHSLGTSVDCTRAALMHSKHIIGQVNPRMPRTVGDAIVHESHFDTLVESDVDLPEHKSKALTDVEKAIGKLIAENLVDMERQSKRASVRSPTRCWPSVQITRIWVFTRRCSPMVLWTLLRRVASQIGTRPWKPVAWWLPS